MSEHLPVAAEAIVSSSTFGEGDISQSDVRLWPVIDFAPKEKSEPVPFRDVLRNMPLAARLRLATALGAVGLITAGGTALGVHIADVTEDLDRATAKQSITDLSNCYDFVRGAPGNNPKIVTISLIPANIQQSCDIAKTVQSLKERAQVQNNSGAEIVDTSGMKVRLPDEHQLQSRIEQLEESTPYGLGAHILAGATVGFFGLVGSVIGVPNAFGFYYRRKNRRTAKALKAAEEYR